MIRSLLSWLRPRQKKNLYFFLQRQFSLLQQPELDRFNTASVLHLLQQKGLDIKTVIDVGAYEGRWSAETALVFPRAQFFLFEPQQTKQQVIAKNMQGLDFTLFQCLLGDEPAASKTFYEMESGSSVMKELSGYPYQERNLPMTTLDLELAGKIMDKPILLKLDVQGFEAAVLRGASRVLEACEVLVLELSFVEYNENAPLAAEMITLLDQLGFMVFDFGGFLRNRNDRSLIQADVIFIRKTAEIRKQFNDFRKPYAVYHTY